MFFVRYFLSILVPIGKRELVALLCLSSWCLVAVVWLYLAMPGVCLQFVIVVFPDHTHLLFLILCHYSSDFLFAQLQVQGCGPVVNNSIIY